MNPRTTSPGPWAGSPRRRATGVFSMWRHTRLVVLASISASLFAALLIPFKLLPLIPGSTELRPANAIPILCSFLFGPAAAWGAAIGNIIGDFFGGFGPGAFFGAIGNFFFGLLPYYLWRAFSDRDPTPSTAGEWLGFAAVLAVSSAACALVIGWGLNALGFVPFVALANIVLVNNFVAAIVLTPLLLRAVYGRVRAAGLCYDDLRVEPIGRGPRSWAGVALVGVASLGGIAFGNLIALGYVVVPVGGVLASQITFGVAPFVALLFLGALLL